jgi:acyl-CoA reductase-like NAD-dependent aldehyde dehydrogenase
MSTQAVFGNFIGGAFSPSSATHANINPSDISDVIGEYGHSGVSEAQQAVAAAKAAANAWANSTPQQRFDVLDAIGTEILARKAEIGRILSREEGKTLPEGIGETNRAGQIFKYFAGEALRPGGEKIPSVRPNIDVEIVRQPIGVVGIITPWNFPIAIPAWKIAPALCFGNAVVFKPAEIAPACGWVLADIISRSGLPEGVFNMVSGSGREVGNAIVNHPDVAGVSFTGSQTVGHQIASQCVARQAKVQLEMGGKNPLVVLDDANLATAINVAVNGAYFSTGQRCTASSRLIVTEGIHDRFVEGVLEAIRSLKVGNALDPSTKIGPVVSDDQLEKNLEYVEIGKNEGARLAWGGERLKLETEGFYQAPALFTDTTPGMRINTEEIFGPVASVIRVRDYEEALAVANDTVFGLSSGICTSSLAHARDFQRRAEAGMVMVNLPTAGVDYHVPFGGRKGSSYGSREQGSYAAEFYTTVKTSYISS